MVIIWIVFVFKSIFCLTIKLSRFIILKNLVNGEAQGQLVTVLRFKSFTGVRCTETGKDAKVMV